MNVDSPQADLSENNEKKNIDPFTFYIESGINFVKVKKYRKALKA